MFNTKIVLWTCLVTANLINLTQSCRNPQGEDGECKNIEQCESMSEMVHKLRKTQAELNLMKKSICGWEGEVPKVCCPLKASEVTTECRTPDGVKGQCGNIYECATAVAVLTRPGGASTEDRTFLEKSRCSGPPETYYVCCPPTPPARPESSTTPLPAPARAECEWNEQPLDRAPSDLTPRSSLAGQCTATALPVDARSGCCGVQSDAEDRIFGGTETGISMYPWLALIEYRSAGRISTNCGGSLISGRYVLTAAHCVDDHVVENVRLGEYDTSNCGADCVEAAGGGRDCNDMPVRIRVQRVIKHALYDAYMYRNDIALLRLARMAPFTPFIAPICLPTVDVVANPPKDRFIVAGWGADSNATSRSNLKQHVGVPYVNHNVCSAWRKYRRLGPGQICAGGEAGKDSCAGDSGGPLMHARATADGRQHELIGVVSFGTTPCAGPHPAVYTNVIKYMDWIVTNMRQ